MSIKIKLPDYCILDSAAEGGWLSWFVPAGIPPGAYTVLRADEALTRKYKGVHVGYRRRAGFGCYRVLFGPLGT